MISKKAFTLAEILVTLTVFAALVIVTLYTEKPKARLEQKAIKTKYASVYNALNLVSRHMAYSESTDPFILTEDDITSGVTSFDKLCKGYTDMINTESEDCNIPPIANNVAFLQNENTDFRNITPHLVSLTGVKLYFSDLITDDRSPASARSYYDSSSPDYTMEFFMIYADLYGTEEEHKEHTIIGDYEKHKFPKVHAFALIPTGRVIPIGVAEYNPQILPTHIAYKEGKHIALSPLYSYRQAKSLAWGWYPASGTSNTRLIKTIPDTYNEFIREILVRKNTKLYDFNSTGIFPETFSGVLYPNCTPSYGSTVYDLCTLEIDAPR